MLRDTMPEHSAVARRHVEQVVGRHDVARARHVLDDQRRIARDVARDVASDQARPEVVVLPAAVPTTSLICLPR